MSQPSHYKKKEVHTPLHHDRKSFRLLILLPGQDDEQLHCQLRSHDLSSDTTPEYETISYCWGDAGTEESLVVNGVEILVRASCAAVLRRVRLPEKVRTVWIDAICINQESIDERNQQVSLMGEIYKYGKRNLIYLGAEDLSDAFATARTILDDPASEDCLEYLCGGNGGVIILERELFNLPSDLSALKAVYAKDWFWRVWTFQEGALSRESVCLGGPSEMTLRDLTKAACILVQHSTVTCDLELVKYLEGCICFYPHLILSPRRVIQERQTHISALLPAFRMRRCKWSVDRIYGLLGLMPKQSIVPDYNKTAIEVFQEAVKVIIADERSLNILSHAFGLSTPADGEWKNAPSWIPNCDDSADLEGLNKGHSMVRVNNGSPHGGFPYDSALIIMDDQLPNLLNVQGFELGVVSRTVLELASLAEDDFIFAGMATVVCQMRKFAYESARLKTESPERQQLAIATTLSVGASAYTSDDEATILLRYQSFVDYVDRGLELELLSPQALTSNDAFRKYRRAPEGAERLYQASAFQDAFSMASAYQKMCLLDTGYLGRGSMDMQEGDVAAVLYGLSSIALLRPTGDGKYRFVGHAWIYGAMNAEALKQHKKSGGSDKIFVLC